MLKQSLLGLPLETALHRLSGESQPEIIITAAPQKDGEALQTGTLRLIRCQSGQWVAARFLDGAPKGCRPSRHPPKE